MSTPEEAAVARASLIRLAADMQRMLESIEAQDAAFTKLSDEALELQESPEIRALDEMSGYVSPVPQAIETFRQSQAVRLESLRQRFERDWLSILDAIEVIDATGEVPMPPESFGT